MVNGAYLKVERISELEPLEKAKEATKLRNDLERFFSQLPTLEIEAETLVQYLKEFLQLPLWKHRYELYSVWIATQILDSLENNSVKIHQVNNTLKFSFSGTHFATIDDCEPRLHIWTELRSPLDNPVGKGRVKSIQPDYSLVTDPITSPESSLLVIECKQYRRPSTKNFSAALSDYARGGPNAHVILVNYGSAKQSILDSVDATVRSRTSLIGMMRPGSIEAQKKFRQLVQESLPNKSIDYRENQPKFNSLLENSMATLKWGDTPKDLDLHLKIDVSTDTYKICYSNQGNITTEPWAILHEDMQDGNGVEIIEVGQYLKGKYHFAVHNFTKDTSFSDSNAIFTITNGELELQLKCPNNGAGKWWSILIIDTNTNQFEVINKIVDVESLW